MVEQQRGEEELPRVRVKELEERYPTELVLAQNVWVDLEVEVRFCRGESAEEAG